VIDTAGFSVVPTAVLEVTFAIVSHPLQNAHKQYFCLLQRKECTMVASFPEDQ
jgi:hypothetical protein